MIRFSSLDLVTGLVNENIILFCRQIITVKMSSVTFGDQVQKMENILNKLRDFSSKGNDIYEGENCEHYYFLFLFFFFSSHFHLKKMS